MGGHETQPLHRAMEAGARAHQATLTWSSLQDSNHQTLEVNRLANGGQYSLTGCHSEELQICTGKSQSQVRE